MAETLPISETVPAVPLGRRVKKWFLARPAMARLGVIAAIFLVWEIAARFLVDKIFLSPPSTVFWNLSAMFETVGVPAALRVSAYEIVVAFVISVVIGLAVGLAVGLQRFTHRSFMPIILLLYGTPQITILPLFILYFGIRAPPPKAPVRRRPRPLPDHRRGGGRPPKLQPDPAHQRALEGREPLAHLPLGDLPSHDPELLRRYAARHDRRAARRAVGGTLRVD